MEIDLAQLDSSATGGDLLRAHICIIGGGIAGLTLAHKLVALGHEVLLLEAGGQTPDSFEPVQQAGHPHPGTSEPRSRALGGTSLTWGGQLLAFPNDSTAWPISSVDLAVLCHRSRITPRRRLAALRCASVLHEAGAARANTSESAPAARRLALEVRSLLTSQPGAHASDTNSARTAKPASSSTRRPPNSSSPPLATHIEAVLVRTPSGQPHRIEADHIILAAGTIETVRLLLASRSAAPEGIGNQNDQVGRNFHDHLTLTAATLRGPARKQLLDALRPWIYRGTLHSLKLSASPELQRQLNLTPILAHLTIDEPDSSGIGALRTLLRARQQNNLASTLRENLPQIPRALADAARLMLSARTQHRRYVSPRATVQLRLNAAQRTPSASRITLSPELQPILDWHIDPSRARHAPFLLSTSPHAPQPQRPRLEPRALHA